MLYFIIGDTMDDIMKQGLTDQQVQERIDNGQVNISKDNISKTRGQIVRDHTLTYFNGLNLFLAAIIISTGYFTNLTFVVVVLCNTVIGIIQEFKVKDVIDKLSVVTVAKVKVIRNAEMKTIPVEELVLDDIVFLENGNQIGTDCKVLTSQGMEVNEALLTGESEPIKKNCDDELLAGSFVVAGSGYGKVIRVGNDNYSTQLVQKAKHKNKASSQMKDSIEKVIKVLSIVIIPVGFILFASQMVAYPDDRGMAIVKTVGGVIGMIPEGLVLLTSLSFILGVGKLATKKALVQEMEAIEALARVDVLCLDKTGTITTGELSVERVYPYKPYTNEFIEEILGCMAHDFDDINATQEALRGAFDKIKDLDIIDKVPFSSKRKMRSITLSDQRTFVLGAPEFLTSNERVLDRVNSYSYQGYRVLYLGETIDNVNHAMALIVIQDCLRDDARSTLRFFNKNNVDVCILSGDNPITVSRVAQLAGLRKADQYIDASILPEDDEELYKVVEHYRIFGRVKPEQKQRIIKAFQHNDHVVGMVGDGVNDVLALKDADCGIAMAAGSDAAKKAAHIVLLDSNFASMKSIVNEGRTIIASIEKVSSLYLTKTIYSTCLCIIFAAMRQSYPFIPIQLSLISSLAIGIPSFYVTLESSSMLSTGGFSKHVMTTALPCALTIIIDMIFINIFGNWLHFDATQLSTYYYLTTGFVSFVVVYIVFMPLNRLRGFIATGLTVLFFAILLFIPDFFSIYSFLNWNFIYLIPIFALSILMFGILKRLIYKLYSQRKYPF